MSDPRERENSDRAARDRQVREFLEDATRDLQRMRGLAVRLEASHSVAWSEVQNLAHNLAARAATLKLGLLNACARELESLADEKLSGTPADAFMMQCVSSAIETIALEIEALKRPR
jgi:HPt (histidine-containing phosphotransfer) domain-containing protein